ncbi:hypothetical protein ACFX11_011201 [Malus domestica]
MIRPECKRRNPERGRGRGREQTRGMDKDSAEARLVAGESEKLRDFMPIPNPAGSFFLSHDDEYHCRP